MPKPKGLFSGAGLNCGEESHHELKISLASCFYPMIAQHKYQVACEAMGLYILQEFVTSVPLILSASGVLDDQKP
jgi:hypothetical protein